MQNVDDINIVVIACFVSAIANRVQQHDYIIVGLPQCNFQQPLKFCCHFNNHVKVVSNIGTWYKWLSNLNPGKNIYNSKYLFIMTHLQTTYKITTKVHHKTAYAIAVIFLRNFNSKMKFHFQCYVLNFVFIVHNNI